MSIYSLATREGQTREMPGVDLVSSGLPLAVFNAALLSTPLPGPEGDLARRLAIARVFFEHRQVPWSLWYCDDLFAPELRGHLREDLRRHQFRVTAEPVGMVAESLQPPRRMLPQLECRLVSDEASRLAFCEVTSVVFELPFNTSRQIYGSEKVWKQSMRGFVGYSNGKPVSTVALWMGSEAIGIYSVGTLPQHQHHGYAEMLLRSALAWAFVNAGARPMVLQSTRQGYALYEHMGFRAVTQFTVYIAPPS